jgi:peptide/nickel transport system permease protein
MRRLGRRLGLYALAAWASLTVNFFLPRLMPGDPVSTMFASFQGQLAPEAIDALRRAYGFTDGPLLEQYVTYLGHVLRGDLGVSIAYFPARVADVLATGLFWTVLLAGTAVLVSFTLGTLLGVAVAWRQDGKLDSILPPALSLLGAFPYFWLAMLALYVLGFRLGWFPLGHAHAGGLTPSLSAAFVTSVLHHAVLPAATLVLATVGGWTLSMRNAMVGVLGADHVSFAEARGLSRRRVVWRHAARNALLPHVTGLGMALGFVLGGALLTEMVFAYPGQGYLLLQAVRSQDYPLLQGIFLAITLAVLAANALVDLACLGLDPAARRT